MAVRAGSICACALFWAMSMRSVDCVRMTLQHMQEVDNTQGEHVFVKGRMSMMDLEEEHAVVNTSNVRPSDDEPSAEEAMALAEKTLHRVGLTFLHLTKKIGQGTAGTIYVASVTRAPTADEKDKLIIQDILVPGSADLLTAGKQVVVKDSIIGKKECMPVKCELHRCCDPCADARKERLYYKKLLNQFGYHNSIARPYAFAEGCDGYKPKPDTPEPAGRAHHFFVMDFLDNPSTFEDCLAGTEATCNSMNAYSTASEVVRVWRELVDGYRYLCNAGIVQQDGWKDNRILAQDDQGVWHAKIVDFGKGADDPEGCGIDLNTLLETANAISEKLPKWTNVAALDRLNEVLQCKVHVPKTNPILGGFFAGRRGCAQAEQVDSSGYLKVSHEEAMKIYDELLAALKL